MNGKSFLQLTALVAASALGGALLATHTGGVRTGHVSASPAKATAAVAYRAADHAVRPMPKPLRYTCPMHPQIVLDHPGSCPVCGMTLVKMDDSPAQEASNAMAAAIHIDTAMQQRMGIVVASVQPQSFETRIESYATTIPDASKVVAVSPKAEGWIKSLTVSAVGQEIHRGQLLYQIYSTDLQQRERDYIDLLARRDALSVGVNGMDASGTPNTMLGSVARERFRLRTRLLAADVPASVVDEIERDRRVQDTLPVLAEHDGVVTDIAAREGNYVNPAQPILTYADTARLWVEFTLYPDQLDAVRHGSKLKLSDPQHAEWSTTLALNHATVQLDRDARLGRVRIPLPAHPAWLQLGMPLQADIVDNSKPVLAIPRDAVIYANAGPQVVTRADAEHFRLVDIKVGLGDANKVQVLAGLHAGDEVVVNGHFLIGAEASIDAARQRMQSGTAGAQP